MAIKLGVIGACGKMGKAIARLASESSTFELNAVIEGHDNLIGKTYQSLTGMGNECLVIQRSILDVNEQVDVYIDFSYYEATLKHLPLAQKKGIGYVIGTTGFDLDAIEDIQKIAKEIPVLLSPNMSLGVNVMLIALEMLTNSLSDNYDIEVIESHHNQKVDAPSGTALKLYEVIENVIKKKQKNCELVHGREGIVGKRKKSEIGMHAIRAGSIVGEHTVLFAGLDEDIALRHRAQSRDTFAKGALTCAEFIYKKEPGFYDMKSVLGL